MLHYTSLLKGRAFKNKNQIKSSFLIEDKKDNCHLSKNESKKLATSIKYKHLKSGEIHNLEKHSNNKLDIDNNDEFLSEDYEDLFFYILYELEKIPFFEKIIENKRDNTNINNMFSFNYLFQLFSGEKKEWNNFLFYEPVYKILYIRSRKLQKEIIQYSLASNKKVEDIINSYNKQYTSIKKVKNWCLSPQEAYKNFENISSKETMKNENVSNVYNPYSKSVNYTDFVVKTDNNGKGKTLIFLGKAINIYIDDINKVQTQDKGISMAVEESEFNKKIKNEIVLSMIFISKIKKRIFL